MATDQNFLPAQPRVRRDAIEYRQPDEESRVGRAGAAVEPGRAFLHAEVDTEHATASRADPGLCRLPARGRRRRRERAASTNRSRAGACASPTGSSTLPARHRSPAAVGRLGDGWNRAIEIRVRHDDEFLTPPSLDALAGVGAALVPRATAVGPTGYRANADDRRSSRLPCRHGRDSRHRAAGRTFRGARKFAAARAAPVRTASG